MIKTPNTGWMAKLAAEKRRKTKQELEHWMIVYAKAYGDLAVGAELLFATLYADLVKSGFTEDDFLFVQRGVIHKIFGDPLHMFKSSGQKQHALPYWNPTHHNINVAPLGLVKEVDEKTREAIIWERVGPGQMIMIPTAYTVGGKYSSLQGVAPQLRPLPRQVDNSLDVSPLTYVEWCTFRDVKLTKCCKKSEVWQESTFHLVCSKCGKHAR